MSLRSTLRKKAFSLRNKVLPRLEGDSANDLIREYLSGDDPFMFARFGAVEIKGILYGILPWPLNLCLKKYVYRCMPNNAGFFPANEENFRKFSKMMLDDIDELDILASWRPEEMLFFRRLRMVRRISLVDTLPGYRGYFWSGALAGKRVLVIHPFSETIESQYQKRDHLFKDKRILPEFASLETVKAVQTIAGTKSDFSSWFEALDYMKAEIDSHEFDVALIGCGAYGFPLAAYCKRKGKQAVHMGGALQLLFGIKGKRWNHLNMYNEYWVSPSESERPSGFSNVEGGCYW